MIVDGNALTPKERRHRLAAMMLLLVCGIMVIGSLWFVWWKPWRAAHTQTEMLLERQSRVLALLSERPVISRALQQAEIQASKFPMLLPETTIEQAVAGLTQRVDSTVASFSEGGRACRIESRMPMPATDSRAPSGVLRASVSVRLRCGNSQWLQVAYALENATPPMFIQDLAITAPPTGPMIMQTQGSGILEISFTLSGYLQPASGMP